MTQVLCVARPSGTTKQYPANLLEEVCLALCGGGLTIQSTKDAMILASEVQEKKSATFNRIHISLKEV
jgi:hypothetical protein